MGATIRPRVSTLKQPKKKPSSNSMQFLDEGLASIPVSDIPEPAMPAIHEFSLQ